MAAFTQESLERALKKLGIAEGDVVLLHSDLLALGVPQGTKTRDDILAFYWHVFQRVLGPKGTLSVPAYFYEYARTGVPFDTETSPVSKSLGAFSGYICSLPQKVRSLNPLQSIASIGTKAMEISGGDSVCGYGVTSPWHRLRKNKAKMVFLGVDMEAMTFVHHIEQAVGVPHLYCKLFSVPVFRGGEPIKAMPVSHVRYLDYGIEYSLKPFQEKLFSKGCAKSVQVGSGSILLVDMEDAYKVGLDLLQKDSNFFLKAPPKFIPGQIPFDGATKKS